MVYRGLLDLAEHGTARVTLELELEDGAIAGSLDAGEGPARPFTGWLQLMSVLEQTRDGLIGAKASNNGTDAPPPRDDANGWAAGTKGR